MPIKILHIIGQMERGGAERQLLYLIEALHERGWQQVVVTLNPGDAWDGRVTAAGVPLISIPRQKNKIARLCRLSYTVQREHPVVVHSWSGHTNVYARWLLNFPRPRLIVSFRGNPAVDNYTGKPLKQVPNASIYATASCVVSNSQAAAECARAVGVRMRRLEVVNNIVIAKARASPGEITNVPRIAAAGALIPLKAYDVLLKSLGQLASEGHTFELLLAGNGPEENRLKEIAVNLKIDERVKFLGGIEDVPALFANAHLLVHSSRSEGLSNTILEGMAEGLPVVATSVGGTPELITDGKTGLLVPPDQPDLLAVKIKELLISPVLRSDLGKAGLELVRDRCSIDQVASQYEYIYESLVSLRPH